MLNNSQIARTLQAQNSHKPAYSTLNRRESQLSCSLLILYWLISLLSELNKDFSIADSY